MHDKCKQVIAFHNHIIRFFKNLIEVCPEFKRQITKCMKYYNNNDRMDYVIKVLDHMKPHIEKISQYDEGIFSNDYCKEQLKLLPGLDFKQIFNVINNEFEPEECKQTKKSIFNHLQSIYITAELANTQISAFNSAMNKQKQMLMDMLHNLNLDANIKERIEKLAAEEKEANANEGMFSPEQLSKLTEMFGEDNYIIKIAKDVAEELNLGNTDFSSPVEAISLLCANNGQKLQELIVSIGEKLEQRVNSGEIDQNKLVQHATQMSDKFKELIPDMANMADIAGSNKFEELTEEEQERFRPMKELLSTTCDISTLTEEQKALFKDYAEAIFKKKA